MLTQTHIRMSLTRINVEANKAKLDGLLEKLVESMNELKNKILMEDSNCGFDGIHNELRYWNEPLVDKPPN